MSKKLIAVAAAAALALTGLVATPATSAVGAFSVAVTATSGGTGLTADAAYTVKIPTQDVLRFNETVGATTSVFRVVSTTPGTTDTVRVVSTGGVKVLTKTAFDALTSTTNNTKAGSQDVSQASDAGNATFYVYSTSTANGTVTVSSGSNSTSFNVKGITPAAYNVVVTNAPSTVPTSVDTKVDFTVTDAFGNAIESTVTTAVITKVGPVTLSNAASLTWDTDRKTLTTTINGSAAGNASINVEIGATKIDAFGTPKTVFFTVAVGGTQTELITALTAQVATLKADYNKLAARWNARVADKKAPKKAVATK
jgi:hypothetical protein